jgi:hypothetical protein
MRQTRRRDMSTRKERVLLVVFCVAVALAAFALTVRGASPEPAVDSRHTQKGVILSQLRDLFADPPEAAKFLGQFEIDHPAAAADLLAKGQTLYEAERLERQAAVPDEFGNLTPGTWQDFTVEAEGP